MRYFEDFSIGQTVHTGRRTVTKEEIIAFAQEYDPQPFHIDEEAAAQTFFGELVASGWHTCAIVFSMIARDQLKTIASLGSPGVEEVKWLRPLRPGDTIQVRMSVIEIKESRSRPELGFVRMLTEAINQDAATIMTQDNWAMIARRPANTPEQA